MKKLLLCSIITSLLMSFQAPVNAAEMSLIPASANLTEGCESTININVNTQGADTRGADAFLSYNPSEIEILSIEHGSMYNSYPGKVINNGNIYITAFSENGFFKGNGALAKLSFKSKPGVKSTTINFKYSPGSTVDSNVAGREANDMLTSVSSGTYTFGPGECEPPALRPSAPTAPPTPRPDTTPPYIDNLRPGVGWENMVPNTNLTFDLMDDRRGIDLDTLIIKLNNIVYTKNGENKFTYEGDLKKYKITVNPDKDFVKEENEKIPVNIKAEDLDGNQFTLDYSFTAYSTSETCFEVRPAAPTITYSRGARIIFWLLFILLLISLITNIWLATEPPVREDEKRVEVKSNLRKRTIGKNSKK